MGGENSTTLLAGAYFRRPIFWGQDDFGWLAQLAIWGDNPQIAVMEELVIIGTGGLGREVGWLWATLGPAAPRLRGWIGKPAGAFLMDAPILGDDAWALAHLDRACGFVVAIGDPGRRRQVAEHYQAAGFRAATLVHPSAQCGPGVVLGPGCIICAGAVLTVEISLGQHVIVNLNSTIGHDSEVGDYVTLAPGVHLSGGVRLGDGCDLGTGAVVLPGCQLGPQTVLGAGAVATRDLPGAATYVGIPARPQDALR